VSSYYPPGAMPTVTGRPASPAAAAGPPLAAAAVGSGNVATVIAVPRTPGAQLFPKVDEVRPVRVVNVGLIAVTVCSSPTYADDGELLNPGDVYEATTRQAGFGFVSFGVGSVAVTQ
jgi:hypothetical protein